MNTLTNPLLDSISSNFGSYAFHRSTPSWFTRKRQEALTWVSKQGFPTSQEDTWKYTRINPIFDIPFMIPESSENHSLSLEKIDQLAGKFGGIRLIFINGHFAPGLSSLENHPQNTQITNISRIMHEKEAFLKEHFTQQFQEKKQAFMALNTVCTADGAFIKIQPNTQIEAPIHLVFLSDARKHPVMSHPRSLIHMGKESHATIIETYVGASEAVSFTNAVTKIILDESAVVNYYKIQNEEKTAFHIGLLDVQQGENSQISTHSIALGSQLARHEVRINLHSRYASSTLNGLYMTMGSQLHDNQTFIDHNAPYCTARELYKGIIDEEGCGVFDGLILVREGAFKTDAGLTNRNLLLSETGQAYTRPQLKIYADDVKCAHGATVGQIHKDSLFYLRSRGILEEEGKKILTYAFMAEMLDLISSKPLQDHVKNLISSRILTFNNEGTII